MRQINANKSIICHSGCGPIFRKDLHICDYANALEGSQSNVGQSYEHPQPEQG